MQTCNSKVSAMEIIVTILSTLSIQQREVTISLSTLFIAYTYFIWYLMSMLVQRGNIFFYMTARLEKGIIAVLRFVFNY